MNSSPVIRTIARAAVTHHSGVIITLPPSTLRPLPPTNPDVGEITTQNRDPLSPLSRSALPLSLLHFPQA